jgi:hypothetical protein
VSAGCGWGTRQQTAILHVDGYAAACSSARRPGNACCVSRSAIRGLRPQQHRRPRPPPYYTGLSAAAPSASAHAAPLTSAAFSLSQFGWIVGFLATAIVGPGVWAQTQVNTLRSEQVAAITSLRADTVSKADFAELKSQTRP